MRILFLDKTNSILTDSFEALGHNCDLRPELNQSENFHFLSEYEGLIVRSKLINSNFIDHATNLKFIGRVGAGMENIDIKHATKKGIKCFNSPEGSRDAVGEHSLALLLALLNKVTIADKEVRAGIWSRHTNWGTEICGKTVAIIGYGNMGTAFAEKISGFNARVIAYDKYKFNYSDKFVEETNMEEIFAKADILSLHIPLSSETNYLINSNYLNQFKKNIYLINTSRGQIVNTADLVKAIKSSKVLGSALDVLEYEKPAFENLKDLPSDFAYLAKSDRCVLSPHVAGWTYESHYKLSKVLFDKIKAEFHL